MELLHRYSGLKQRIISERFGSLDEGLVSRNRRVIQEKIGTEPKIRKWSQDIVRLSSYPKSDGSSYEVKGYCSTVPAIGSFDALWILVSLACGGLANNSHAILLACSIHHA